MPGCSTTSASTNASQSPFGSTDTPPGSPGYAGSLQSVGRTINGTTSTSTVVYNVPTTTSGGGPYALDPTSTQVWGADRLPLQRHRDLPARRSPARERPK